MTVYTLIQILVNDEPDRRVIFTVNGKDYTPTPLTKYSHLGTLVITLEELPPRTTPHHEPHTK